FKLIVNWYVTFAERLLVSILKIHCWPVGSHLNAVSGVVESTTSSIGPIVPVPCPVIRKVCTTAGDPIDVPLALQTRNFAGTVLFCLNTLLPSGLIGCRMACPGDPRHAPVE